jgi:SecD/SecF fusion protein
MNSKNGFWHWLILLALAMMSVWLVTTNPINLGIDLAGGFSFTLQVEEETLVANNDGKPLTDEDRKDAQERALEVIRNRIDGSGIKEAVIYPEPGSLRIIMQIPGVGEEERKEIEETLKQQAYLAFRTVHKDNSALTYKNFTEGKAPRGYVVVPEQVQLNDGRTSTQYSYMRATAEEGDVAEGEVAYAMGPELWRFASVGASYEFMLSKETENGVEKFTPFYVAVKEDMSGEYVETASVTYDQLGRPQVSVSFDSEGKNKFGNITQDLAPGGRLNPNQSDRRQLAIVLDDTLYSAPNINEPIMQGSAVISGGFDAAEAQQLAVVLRAGSLPAPVEVLTSTIISPTLGQASIDSGIRAMLIGSIAVIIFMFIYYMMAGFVVNVALILDVILLPLGMVTAAGFLGIFVNVGAPSTGALPTLTLPGIAGLILTIGMAVDANVLIFERIREEQREGKRFSSAVTAGFEKVTSTILDANVTTLLVAVILFLQGSGPIRGFAVTLTAGILVSMYTALIFTRLVFNLLAEKSKIDHLKMLSIIPANTHIDFISKRKICGVLSLVVILGVGGLFFNKGMDNYGVDLTGGWSFLYESDQSAHSLESLEEALAAVGVQDPHMGYQSDIGDATKQVLEVKVKIDEGEKALETLNAELGEGTLLQENKVGSQVGSEMRSRGVKAIVWALIGIIIYITFRFEFGYALGTIAALIHDVIITVGIYCALGNQMSLPIIAALLTIVGYSANDTIVVFDRIREDVKLLKNKTFKEIANISINHCLGRTLMTSITTLLTVVMLLIFGGGAIRDFALALFIGVIVGTYSSVFIATPVMLLWQERAEKKAKAAA